MGISYNIYKGRTRIFYLTFFYQMHTCRTSCFSIIFKIQLIFYETESNQDDSLADLKTLATVMISIVFAL